MITNDKIWTKIKCDIIINFQGPFFASVMVFVFLNMHIFCREHMKYRYIYSNTSSETAFKVDSPKTLEISSLRLVKCIYILIRISKFNYFFKQRKKKNQ